MIIRQQDHFYVFLLSFWCLKHLHTSYLSPCAVWFLGEVYKFIFVAFFSAVSGRGRRAKEILLRLPPFFESPDVLF